MITEPLDIPLIAEHERAQRLASLNRLADLVRAKGAREPSLHTLLTSFHEFLKTTGTYSISPSAQVNAPFPETSPQEAAIPLSQVTIQPLTWLWPERIPRGKLTLLDGTPGSGTSLLALTLAAHLSSGRPLPGTPDPSTLPTPANVLLIAPHDDAADTIAPRFAAAGGDPNHLFLLNTVETVVTSPTVTMAERPFCLPDNLALLEATIERLSVALVIIDPLHSVLSSARSHSSSRRPSPRNLLFSLTQLARRTGCALLLIRHVRTSPSDLRHPRPSGSPDLVSAARSSLLLVADPNDEETHLLVPTKYPLSWQPAILAYQVVEHETGVPVIHWLANWRPPTSAQSSPAPTISAQRQAILDFLLESPAAVSPRETAARTGYDYACVRKMMQRLCQEGDLVSPTRGLYTLPGHPCLLPGNAAQIPPSESNVPNVSNNPNDEKTLHPLPNQKSDLTHVANVPGDANIHPISIDTDQKCSILSGEQVCDPCARQPGGPQAPISRQVSPSQVPPSDPSENRFPSATIPPRDDSPW